MEKHAEPLLKILFERSPLAIRERSLPRSGVGPRAVRSRGPFRVRKDKTSYLLPAKVIKALNSPDLGEQLSVPADVENLIVVSRTVCESKRVNLTHVGLALRSIRVTDMLSLGRDTQFTVAPHPGRAIGEQLCMETGPNHSCFWAIYKDQSGKPQSGVDGQTVFRRFVEKELPIPTDKITLVLRYESHRLKVIAAYYGEPSRKLPGTTGATQEDQLWWYDPKTQNGHAFVLIEEMRQERRIVATSVTSNCPW